MRRWPVFLALLALARDVPAICLSGGGTPPPVSGAPMTTANRTSGVAPLSVFFDAVDDVTTTGSYPTFAWTSGVTQPSDMEGSQWSWDFGDPSSGAWSTTGKSKNTATGYTAAHVFETPGTYTVGLTVTDTAGVTRTYVQTITVTAFSGATYYSSAAGSGTACSQASPCSFATGLSNVNGGSNRRLLLNRGDSFTMNTATLSANGPNIIGAYGTGNRPIINSSASIDYTAFTVTGSDWRMMDLDIRTTAGAWSALGGSNSSPMLNTLWLRIYMGPGWFVSFGNGDSNTTYRTPHDGVAVVDCEANQGNAAGTTYGAYIGGRRLALLGNNIHDINGSHALRVWQAHKGVISNNRLWNPGATRQALKLHSQDEGGQKPPTRWVSVSDNVFRGKTWTAAIGSQDTITPEQPTHVIVERNTFNGESSIQIDLLIHDVKDVLARNNVFNATGSSAYYSGITITNLGGVLTPGDHNRAFNNTIVRTDASSEMYGVCVSGVTNVTVRNTLTASGASTNQSISVPPLCSNGSAPGSGYTQDHNTAYTVAGAGLANAAGGDFSLTSSSAAVNAGATIPEVREDFLRNPRPLGTAHDLGAYERVPATNMTVATGTRYQTIDGMGTNIHTWSWRGTGETRSAIDALTANGTSLWRVIHDRMDWVTSEADITPLRNLDSATLARIYETSDMQNLWATISYLNSKGITGNQIVLNFMGWTPTWMGGSGQYNVISYITTGKEASFATMVASLVYYGRVVKGLSFGKVAPLNEPDWNGLEGPRVVESEYTTIAASLATQLDAMGLSDIRIVIPDPSGSSASGDSYASNMQGNATAWAKVSNVSAHSYSGSGQPVGGTYSGRTWWMTETAAPDGALDNGNVPPTEGEWPFSTASADIILADVLNGYSSVLVWEGWDAWWYHHNAIDGWGLLGVTFSNPAGANSSGGTYTMRKRGYANGQITKALQPGMQRVSVTTTAGGISGLTAGYNPTTGKIGIVGRNTGASSVTFVGTISGAMSQGVVQLYETNSGAKSMTRGSDVYVGNGIFTVTVGADTVFTLVGP